MGKLNTGGVLAAQLPINGAEPLYRIIAEVTAQPMWGLQNGEKEVNEALSSDEYFDILSVCSCNFSLWETVYYHNMPTHQALLEWVRGTRLRPYLAKMDKASAAAFEKVILDRVMQIYPIRRNGEIVLRFRRLFLLQKNKEMFFQYRRLAVFFRIRKCKKCRCKLPIRQQLFTNYTSSCEYNKTKQY